MKKTLLLSLAASVVAFSGMAQMTYQTKGYGVMQTDDIYTVKVGPGTVETKTVVHFSTDASDKVEDINAQATVNILKVDLNNRYVTPKVAFADKYKIQDVFKTIPEMMAENTSYQNHYFAGVNGDFFGYITCGVTVADGKYVYAGNFLNDNAPFEGNHFIIDKDGLPYIADHIEFGCGLGIRNGYPGDKTLFGQVTYPDGSSNDQLRYNDARSTDYLVLYSQYVNRETTGTNMWGNEASLTPVGSTMFGAEGEFKVGELTKNGVGGNMTIPTNGYVLSGHGESKFETILKRGDKVKVTIPFKADGVENSCRETVGGWPRLVTDGTPLAAVPSQTPSDLGGSSRRARTAVGFSQDRKTLYIVVVEEGSTKNQGMTFKALGSFMEAIGCYNAMNFDGGGSSVMHVENLGQRTVVQGLTTTYNRPVMNGLFLATNAPEDREIASIEIVDKALNIKPGQGYVPTIYGYNKYDVLVCNNVTEFTLSAPEGTATFTSGNRKMIAPESGEFTLTAKYGNATYEIPVKVSADGINGVDPTTEATFAAQETTPIPEKPADWEEESPEAAIYIAGNFNGWKPQDPMIVKSVEGTTGLYEFDIEHTDAIAFKFTTLDPRMNGDWEAFKAEGASWHIDNILAPGRDVELIPGNKDNITTPWAGKFHFLVDIEKATISVTTETPRPAIAAPEHLYLIGSLEDHDWDTSYTGAELTATNGVYTIENVTLTGDEAAYFAFTTTAAASWDEVNATPRYGAWKSDAVIADGTDDFFECWNSWKVAPGNYNFTVDFNTGKLTAEKIYEPVEAELVDVTPWGYDFDRYEDGAQFKIHSGAGNEPEKVWWTSKSGIYDRNAVETDGHFTTLTWPGAADLNTEANIEADNAGFTVHDFGGYLGKCLVINQPWSPLATETIPNAAEIFGEGKPALGATGNRAQTMGIGFYCDKDAVQHNWPAKAIRVRLVFNIMRRGCHAAAQGDKGLKTAYGFTEVLAEDNGGTAAGWYCPSEEWDAGTQGLIASAAVPVLGSEFAKWENEGTCVAEIPDEIKPIMTQDQDPFDNAGHDDGKNVDRYLMQLDRFMVYEWDVFMSNDAQNLKLNLTFDTANMSILIKEIKFFNISNANDLLIFDENGKDFTYGPNSLMLKRQKSWRYYTEKGVEENKPSGVENVIEDTNDDAPVEYYNLQGVRVQNPANGLYIKRQGNKVTKVIVR